MSFALRRRGLRAASAAAVLSAMLVSLFAASDALAAGCTVNWTNATGGSWTAASNWDTKKVPTGSDEACIKLAGEYTVTINTAVAVKAVTLGAASGATTQTLAVQSVLGAAGLTLAAASTVDHTGVLILDAQMGGSYAVLSGVNLINKGTLRTQVEGAQPDYLRVNLENAPGAKLEAQSGELLQDQGTTTTNEGTITISAPATYNITSASGALDNMGTVANSGALSLSSATWTQEGQETGHSVALHVAVLLDKSGAASFELFGSCSFSGNIPAQQTITAASTVATGAAVVSLTGTPVTNEGLLIIDSQKESAYAVLSGVNLINKGTLRTQVEGAQPDYLRVNLENAPGAKLEAQSGELLQDQGTTTTNEGTITISAPATYNITSASGALDNMGTVANSGALSLSSATWTQEGQETGHSVALHVAVLLDKSGAASFELFGSCSFSGNIPAQQTITAASTVATGAAVVSLTGTPVTNEGLLIIDSQKESAYAVLSGVNLINKGTLRTQVEGAQPDYLRVNLENAPGAKLEAQSGELLQDQGTTTTNEGTITISAPATYNITSASGALDNMGTVANSGALSLSSATWTQEGQETGHSVALHVAVLLDKSGAASFELFGSCSFSGNIPAQQTITAASTVATGAAVVSLTGTPVTNEGLLIIDSQKESAYAVLSGVNLINKGTLRTQVEGAQPDYLRVNLENAPGAKLEAQSGELLQDQGTTTTNEGTITISAPATYNITSASGALDNHADGELAFAIASDVTFGRIHLASATFNLLGGTADPILASGYHPAVGTRYEVITGADPGQFTTVLNNFSGDYTQPSSIALVRGRENTATSLSSSANPSLSGAPFTLTATVTPASNAATSPTGAVTFMDGSSVLGSGAVSTSAGVSAAVLRTGPGLAIGSHAITASYGGDVAYQPSVTGSPLTQAVQAAAVQATVTVPAPALARTGNIAPVAGRVLLKLPGAGTFVALGALREIPFGSVVDASNGTVSVTTASPHGGTQTGQFFAGQFRLTQGRDGMVLATLTGGDFSVCARPPRATHAGRAHASAAHAPGRHVVRKLWANAHGSFTTRGNYAAGAVQGTEWLTEDLCEGTLIRVTRDKVKVSDLVRHRSTIVRARHSYLAKPR